MPQTHRHNAAEEPAEVSVNHRKARTFRNWLDYHILLLVIAAASAVIGWTILRDRSQAAAVDQSVGYVGSVMLDDQTIAKLETELARYAPDTNGDGIVTVALVPYYIDFNWGEESGLSRADIQAA